MLCYIGLTISARLQNISDTNRITPVGRQVYLQCLLGLSIWKVDNAPDWTRTSMPTKAQVLNLLCIPNSTTGAFNPINYTHQ